MEHTCQQCGTAVEDGRPFCPHCRAPQISVKVAVAEVEPAISLNAATDPLASEISVEPGFHSAPPLRPAVRVDRRIGVHAAIKAGILGVFVGMIPLLGIVLTGVLAVYFYRRESGLLLNPRPAARLGGAAGVVASAINALWLTIRIFVFHAQQEYIDLMTKFAQKMGINPTDPDFQASIHAMSSPTGLAFTFLVGMIVAVVFASIGGALGSLFMRPSDPGK